MTDIFESINPSPDDLQFTLEFIEGAIASGDYSQALKMAKKALKASEEQYWADIFEGLIEKITNQESLNLVVEESQIIENKSPTINNQDVKYPKLCQKLQEESIDDLSQLPGVGPAMAQKLHNAGYLSFDQLSRTNPEKLSQIKGIGIATAIKIISSSGNQINPSEIPSRVQNMLDFELPIVNSSIEIDKATKLAKKNAAKEPLIQNDHQILNRGQERKINFISEPFNGIEDHKNIVLNGDSADISTKQKQEAIEKEIDTNEEEVRDEIESEQTLTVDAHIDEIQSKKNIKSIFEENGYVLFPRNSSSHFYFHGIDGIGLILFPITPSSQSLLIIPYKISPLTEKVMVSESNIDLFQSKQKPHLPYFEGSLLKNRDNLIESIKSDGKLINQISSFLSENINLEHTIIHIEPLLIFPKVPGFIEKSITFAYQKQNQLHIIGLTQVKSFLEFLQKKIFYIEAYALSRQIKNNNGQSSEVINKKIHRLSYPFIGYGVILGLIIALRWYEVLKLCITIGYASIIFYLIGLVFLMWKNHQQKKHNFAQHLPSKSLEPLTFDEDDLTLIKEELTLKQIAQFNYECFGKQNPYKIFEEVEKKQLEKLDIQNSNKITKEVQGHTLPENSLNPKITVTNKQNELVKKYSSFLED